MKLVYYRGREPNFGDELNVHLWGRLAPELFDDDDSELFLGIGSIFHDIYPKDSRKIVMGSGFAAYHPPPELDDTWKTYFVRGPTTARLLGLPAEKAICDAAILLRALPSHQLPRPRERKGIAFMPHFESLKRGLWERACELAGITLIDARADVMEVIFKLRSADLVICEALHGAIVADAFRIPWIAVVPLNRAHHLKWHDWARSLDVDLRQRDLAPSTLFELYTKLTGRGSPNGRAGKLLMGRIAGPTNEILVERAARCLQALARQEPQLSEDRNIEDVTERAYEQFEHFRMKRNVVVRFRRPS